MKGGTLTVLVVDETPETARRYYANELGVEGWRIDLDANSGDMVMLNATKGARTLAVAIAESDGETTITLIESGH